MAHTYDENALTFFKNKQYTREGQSLDERISEITEKVREYEDMYSHGLADRIKDMIERKILIPSTPQWSNFGRPKDKDSKTQPLNCSCNIVNYTDSIAGIYFTHGEIAMLSKLGAGVGASFLHVSETGTEIDKGFFSNDKLDWIEDSVRVAQKVSQTNRRGYTVPFISIEDKSFYKLMERADKKNPDKKDPLVTNNVGIILPEDFWDKLPNNPELKKRYLQVIQQRREKGKIYLLDVRNCNKNLSPVYEKLGHKVDTTNICCVTGDTKVLTSKGHIPIIEGLDKEHLVWNGEEYTKTTFKKIAVDQPIYRVTFSNGQVLDCTENHNFYVSPGYGKKSVKKTLSELQVGDKMEKFNLPTIEGTEVLESAYTQGFFSGDGTMSDKYPYIFLYGEKKSLSEYIDKRANKLNGEPLIRTSKCSDRVEVGIPEYIKPKNFVPSASYTIKSRLEWLSGLLDSDGTVTTNKSDSQTFQISSTNKEFLIEVQLLLQELGCYSKISKGKDSGVYQLPKNDGTGDMGDYYCKDVYRLLISTNSLYKLMLMGLDTKRVVPEIKKPQRDASYFNVVESIESLETRQDVYCFTELSRGRGVFNGVLTGQCEIVSPSYEDKTMTCIIASLNLVHWDEIEKNPQMIKDAYMFLDINVEEYIKLTEGVPFLERARKSAIEKRDIGLGTMALHSLFQQRGFAFGDIGSRILNNQIYSTLREVGEEYAKEMGEKLGSPLLCQEAGLVRRNVSLLAIAPNKSSAMFAGNVSGGVEPYISNYFVNDLAGVHSVFKNPYLKEVLNKYGKDTVEVWESISKNSGSVQHLDFLDKEYKDVFRTANEISPKDMIDLASDRQRFIDMAQSLNLFGRPNYTLQDVYNIHKYAFDKGIKTLYYYYPAGHASIEKTNGEAWDDCVSCAD